VYKDEVGSLYDDFNSMLEKVEQRGRERDEAETISQTYQSHLERLTDELEVRVKDRTVELQDSLETLKSTQGQLIESEKMSSLGNLVAGVAHEVNTPLGISITAASIFQNEIKSLKDLISENKLSKSALEHFLDTIQDADEILVKNLERAALLVRNFKKISVDQSSEEIRDFELNSYLKEVISTFKNELKHRPITLDLKLDKNEIAMHSFPGAISQLIVNMLQNSLLHGFDEDEEGEIIIETKQTDEKVIIHFSDNGKGVDKEVADRIFEPFITTKRNSGGTGLGLNITYNLVTQHLNGTIKLDPDHNTGAAFIVEIPCLIS
jgi:signal transduction histidine kinase